MIVTLLGLFFSLKPLCFYLSWIILSSAGESGEITTTYLLLGVWAQKNSAGHKVLAALGFNDEKAKELENFVSSETFLYNHGAIALLTMSLILFFFNAEKSGFYSKF